ncbi:hypothetical protein IJV79_00530 [bacterium]|nr:hypothetical protein [bacterium]
MSSFDFTSYDFYSNRYEEDLVTNIVDSLKKILEEDRQEKQPLFLRMKDGFLETIAQKLVEKKLKTLLIGISGESASGKSTFVDWTVRACVKDKIEGIYTVLRCDDYYKDTSKELREAGSYEALFRTGFSFDTPDALNLELFKQHLVELKKGNTVVSPRYDFVTCESFADGDVKKPARIVLSEGLYVLNESIRDVIDVKVYVYTPLDVLKSRWYKRAATRGKTGEAADSQFLDVNRTAQLYIRPAMEISDVVINGLVDVGYIQEITKKIFSVIENSY